MYRYVIILILISKTIFADATPDTLLAGTITHVRDGDTIEIGGIAVRLQGITCDEMDTRRGQQTQIYLADLISKSYARCTLNGKMTYNRLVGRCGTADIKDIGYHLIEQKYCGRCVRYDDDNIYSDIQNYSGTYAGYMPKYCGK